MAVGQDFLSLTNAVLTRFNEVNLTSSTFGAARGFHAQVKDAVNYAIRDINASGAEWPFNWTTLDLALTPDTQRYPFPADAKVIDAETFRILRDAANGIGSTRRMDAMSYDDWLQTHGDEEGNVSLASSVPSRVAIAKNQTFIVSPAPDKAYTLRYEYYAQPTDLVLATDETNIPQPYRFVIVDCAAMHCHIFRTDMEAASSLSKLYERGLKDMRKNLINRSEYLRPTLSGI
jgi:hypothetical protein